MPELHYPGVPLVSEWGNGYGSLRHLVGGKHLLDRSLLLFALEAGGDAQVLRCAELNDAALADSDGGFAVAGDQHGVACVQAGAGGGFADEAVAADADVACDGDDLTHRGFFGGGRACSSQKCAKGGECKAEFHGGSPGKV